MLEDGKESSNRPRDIRNEWVTLIAGQPTVSSSTLTLACPPAKAFECVRTAEPKCA